MHTGMTLMGDIVRSAREAKCLSQAALAELMGVSTRTIIELEKNRRTPSYEVFHRLVHALDISADLIVYPDRAPFTVEQEQFIHDLLACDQHEQKIAIAMLQSLLRTLRHDEPEKQD